jgi:colicin import membrane protein
MTPAQHLEQRREPGKWASIGLAACVHLVLLLLLVFGIRWQNRAPEAVEVDLYRAPAAPAAQRPPPPEPKPQPRPEPRPEPKPEPKPAPPPPKPDIALKDREKPKPAPKEAPRPQPEPRRDLLKEQLARETEDLNRRRMQQEAEREANQLRDAAAAAASAQAAAALTRAQASWRDRISQKIRGNIVEPPGVAGNPRANFLVSLLPDGSVFSVKLRKSTGNPALDAAIERAINKSSPLPKPEDPAAFARELSLDWALREE